MNTRLCSICLFKAFGLLTACSLSHWRVSLTSHSLYRSSGPPDTNSYTSLCTKVWACLLFQVSRSPFPDTLLTHYTLSQSFIAQLEQLSEKCNYTGYREKWATYPPVKGPFPSPGENIENNPNCNLFGLVIDAALDINPAFNIYHVLDTWPIPWDVLGSPFVSFFVTRGTDELINLTESSGSIPDERFPVYFNLPNVKKLLHVPSDVDWRLCTEIDHDVFVDRTDNSLPSAFTVLPNVIEKNKRTVIMHGLGDFILIAEG